MPAADSTTVRPAHTRFFALAFAFALALVIAPRIARADDATSEPPPLSPWESTPNEIDARLRAQAVSRWRLGMVNTRFGIAYDGRTVGFESSGGLTFYRGAYGDYELGGRFVPLLRTQLGYSHDATPSVAGERILAGVGLGYGALPSLQVTVFANGLVGGGPAGFAYGARAALLIEVVGFFSVDLSYQYVRAGSAEANEARVTASIDPVQGWAALMYALFHDR